MAVAQERIFVANKASDGVSVVNGFTNLVETTLGGTNDPISVVVDADDQRAYVLNEAGNSVAVFDTSSLTNPLNIAGVGGSPRSPAASSPVVQRHSDRRQHRHDQSRPARRR